jgi:glucuronokinase
LWRACLHFASICTMQVHSTVRKRWLDGDQVVRSCMQEVASIAVTGREALLQQDFRTIAKLMDRNFDLRR